MAARARDAEERKTSSMQIEVGKRYLDREGAEIIIIGTNEEEKCFPFVGEDANGYRNTFTPDGHYTLDGDCVYDLVTPAPEPAPVVPAAPKSPLPDDSAARKSIPIWEGVIAYAPAAIAAAARISVIGNNKHNPGEELHHARGKSMDHTDCIARHLIDFQAIKAAAMRDAQMGWASCASRDAAAEHLGNLVWRSLMFAQEQLEEMGMAPLAPRARLPKTETNK